MFSFSLFLETAFPQAYLTKHVLFLYFTRQTWQSMFSLGLFLHNGISPGILDKVWQSMFSFSLFLQNGISPGILDKARSLSACFCKTAFRQAYLTKHVLFQLAFAKRHLTRPTWQTCSLLQTGILSGMLDKACCLSAYLAKRHFTRHTWQSMFSFSLFLENGTSPGILDQACSLSIFHQADLTKHVLFQFLFAKRHTCQSLTKAYLTKHVLFQLVFAKRHFTRHTTKHVFFQLVFAKRHFTRHTWQTWQNMFSFSLVLQNGISPGILDKVWQSMFSFSLSCKTAFHQAYLAKHVLFQLAFAKRHFTRHTWQNMTKHDKTWQNMFSFGMILQTGIPSIRYTWQSMFSFSLFLQNGTSPGILDKDDKACSLSACFWKTSFHQAYLTTHVLFFSETIFHQAYLTKHERVWEGSGKAKNAAWKGGWVLHGSQEWGGKGLGRLKMVPKSVVGAPSHPTLRNHEKHPNPFSCFIFSLPNPSHPTLAPKPLFHASFLVFPPTPLLGTMKHEAWSMKRGLGASWFPRVGWEGLGKAQNEAWKRVWVLHGSQAWGGKGLGRPRIKHEKGVGCFMAHKSGVGRAWEGSKWFPRVLWEWFGKAKNEAWKGVWVLHGSQEWGGKGLGTLGMKHEKGFGCFSWLARVGWEGFGKAKNEAWKRRWVFLMIPKGGVGRAWEGSKWFPRVLWEWFGKAKNDAWKRGCVLHGSQEWGGKGLGTLKMKHEKGFGCFSWLPRVGWEGFGKAKNEAWKGGWVFLIVPKSKVGRMEASAVGDSAGRRKRSLRHLTRPLLEFTTWTLAFVPPSQVWQIFWHSIWHISRHSIWHKFWHSIWHSIWIYSDMVSGILLGIYSGILSHIYSGTLSGILPDILYGILEFFLAYSLTSYLTCVLAFYVAFYLTFSLAFYLT